jgi:hypothetical protein
MRLKKEKKIKSVILYSNNNNDIFIGYVLSFIHDSIDYNLFDLSISLNHTHNKNKNLKDLIQYSNGLLNSKSSIFFIDDKDYNDMKTIDYYIKCESYKYYYSKSFIENKLNKNDSNNSNDSKNKISQSIYSIISKEIISKLRLFAIMNI